MPRIFKIILISSYVTLFSPAYVYAAAGPTQHDYLPKLVKIAFRGADVIFNNEYVLQAGNLEKWSSPYFSKKRRVPRQSPACKVPTKVWTDDRSIMICEEDSVWLKSSGYCSEGANRTGKIYSYSKKTGTVKTYDDIVPKCETPASAVRIENLLWVGTYEAGELGTYGGTGVLVYDLTRNKVIRTLARETLADTLIVAIAHNPADRTVWVTTQQGIHKYLINEDRWEKRYFSGEVEKNNKLKITLVKDKPTEEHLWMIAHLQYFKIKDQIGFVQAWSKLDWDEVVTKHPTWREGSMYKDLPLKHKSLLEFYEYACTLKNPGAGARALCFGL